LETTDPSAEQTPIKLRRVGYSLLAALLLTGITWLSGASVDRIGIAAIATLTIALWITEAIPLGAASLLPLVLVPMLPSFTLERTVADYTNPVVFLFLGGLILARAIEVTHLHRLLAYRILRFWGQTSHAVLLGFVTATAFLSMWISNTAAAVIMLPLAAAVAERLGKEWKNLEKSLYLGVAWSASIGGLATLIGSPPNAVFAAFIRRETGVEVSFLQWAAIGAPFAAVGVVLLWQYFCRISPRIPNKSLPSDLIELLKSPDSSDSFLGRNRKIVGAIFVGVVALWCLRPLIGWKGVTDHQISLAAGALLLLIPAGAKPLTGPRLLRFADLRAIPWSILLLVGGGLSLSTVITDSGLIAELTQQLNFVGNWPMWLGVAAIVALVIFATEFGSNTAIVTLFLPTTVVFAPLLGIELYSLALAIAMAGSLSFMMPMATPPNAAVFAKGHVTIRDMMWFGMPLNLVFAALITAVALLVR